MLVLMIKGIVMSTAIRFIRLHDVFDEFIIIDDDLNIFISLIPCQYGIRWMR